MTDELDAVRQRAATDSIYKLHALDWECLLDLATQAFEDRDALLAKVEKWKGMVEESVEMRKMAEARDGEWRDQAHKYAQERDRYAHTVARVEKLADSISPLAHGHACELADDIRAALDGDPC